MLHKEAPGMALAMLTGSLQVTPLAMLSRYEFVYEGEWVIFALLLSVFVDHTIVFHVRIA